MRIGLLIGLWLTGLLARADTFVVTTPLDNAPTGSLRWALNMARSNNNGATYDTIRFNIPSTQPNARAFQLSSELPELSSYLVIDATTQLAPPFGATDARIQIFPQSFPNCKRGFIMINIHHVEIYGVGFAGFINDDPTQPETYRDAIYMWNCHDIIIGAEGRGNAFTANYHCIRHEGIPPRPNDPPPVGQGYNITIQNNVIGKNNTGRPLTREGSVIGVRLIDVYNVTIGGYLPSQANKFMIFLNAINLGLRVPDPTVSGEVLILKNTLIPGTTTIPFPAPIPLSGITINDNDVVKPGDHLVRISGNDLQTVATGISLTGLKRYFNIVNNTVNCNRNNNDFPVTFGITLNRCDSGLIGGVDSANIIFRSDNGGITETLCKYIEKSRNSIYCNPVGIQITNPAVPPARITDMYVNAAGTVFGKTSPRASIEVFSTNSCTPEYYNGEIYEQTITADPSGDFTYNTNPVDCFNRSFTTTNNNGSTSRFYVLNDFVVDSSAVVIQHATCGRSNGSITGMKIFSLVDFHWEDAAGNIVSIDTNLVNVPAGLYRLVATKQNVLCDGSTGFYQILTVQPVINASNAILTHPVPQCNRPGSITNIQVTGVPPINRIYTWTNQLGAVVGTSQNLLNVPAGDYRLTVSINYDPNCTASAGPFTLTDMPAPAIDASGVRINNSSCGQNNGSITGIAIQNATGAQLFRWFRVPGNVLVGSSASLLNAGPGTYYLQYDDASPCPPINSANFTIVNNGLVTVDQSQVQVRSAGCTVPNGAITGMVVTGANRLEWINVNTGAIVGANIDLVNIAAGTYRLRALDNVNGCRDSSADINVPVSAIIQLNVNSISVSDEFCSAANGAISNIILSPTPVAYQFRWVRNGTDTFSNTLNISGLVAADYRLLAIDTNGCVQVVTDQVITDHPAPIIDSRQTRIKDDECTQRIGSISQPIVSGGDAPLSYAWYLNGSSNVFAVTQDLQQLYAGDYHLVVTDKNGCRDTSSIFAVNNISLTITPPQYEEAWAKRNSFAIIKNLNGITGQYEIFDAPFSTRPIITNTNGNFTTPVLRADKEYWVEQVLGTCRSARVRVKVNVIDFSQVFVPNAFTPNGDGLNDELRIRVFGKILIDQFVIMDRWGRTVFLTNDIKEGWNGIFKGKPVETGTYVWIIQGYDIDGTPLNRKGYVTLIR